VTLTGAYGALAAGVGLWAFLVSRLRAKSWQTKGAAGAIHEGGATQLPPSQIGLLVFLGVVTSLFALFIAAYHMRMMAGMLNGDWIHSPLPRVLWVNTAVLILASVAMQWASAATVTGEREALRGRLVAGGVLAGAFLVGQMLAWREVSGTEFFSPLNPAIAFFYLLTAVHGLHLLGGLFVWGRTVGKLMHAEVKPADVSLTVRLCAYYWHYLLLVWLVLFGLMLST
jgi:cytochrome c oxidase subunit III